VTEKMHIKLERRLPIKQPNLVSIKPTQLGWFDEQNNVPP
jgi:hypothetical protein